MYHLPRHRAIIAYVVAAVIGLAVLWGHHAADPALIAVAAAFCLVALGIPAVVLWVRRRGAGRLPPRLLHFPASATLLHALAEAPLEVLRSPVPLAATVLLQLAVFLLDSATLWVMFSAVGQPIPLATAVAGFMMGSVVATLAPIPLGLGSFEAAAVGTLGLLDVPLETALTAVLLLRGFTFWLPMLPGHVARPPGLACPSGQPCPAGPRRTLTLLQPARRAMDGLRPLARSRPQLTDLPR